MEMFLEIINTIIVSGKVTDGVMYGGKVIGVA